MARKTFVFLNFLGDSPFLGWNWEAKARMARRRCSIMRRDVDDESGPDRGEGGGIQDFERTVRLAVDGKLLKASKKAGFVAKCRGMVVVGVAGFPIRKNDGFGPELSNDGGQAELVLAAGLDIGVRDAKRAAPAYAKNLGGSWRLLWREFRECRGCPFRRR